MFGDMFEMCNMFVVCVYLSLCIYGKCAYSRVLSIGMSVCACLWREAVCVAVCILNPIPTMETDWESPGADKPLETVQSDMGIRSSPPLPPPTPDSHSVPCGLSGL